MSAGKLQIILTGVLVVVGGLAFVAVDFVNTRNTAETAKPNFAQYVAGFVQKERASETGQIEAVAAMGDVPASVPPSAEPGDEDVAVVGADVVSRDAVAPPSSWFRREREEVQVRVEFVCVKGVGGSKVCTAETLER